MLSLDVLYSWGAVYTAIFLPAVLILLNFVFGSCFVSEALTLHQHTSTSHYSRARLMGRGCVAAVLVSFVWQYYDYMFVARESISGREAALCNPVHFLWDVVDALPSFGKLDLACLVDCTWDETVYQSLLAAFLFFFVRSVFSVPQVSQEEANRLEKMGSIISRCSKCGSCIEHMDHHCYLICNCVGRRNRRSFILCLCFAVLNLSFLLWWCGQWAVYSNSTITLIGLVLVIGFFGFMAALLVFQVLLLCKGETTISFLKRSAGLSAIRRLCLLVSRPQS